MPESKVSYFLNLFLQRPASSIPKGSIWAVYFTNIKGKILPAIELAYQGEPNAEMWKTKRASEVLLSEEYNEADGMGCLFCEAIDLPGEGSTPVAEGSLKYNSYIRGYVGAGRNDFPIMRMSFLETNVSFADSILRGWSLATAKFGMIARNGSLQNGAPDPKNYRTDMTCIRYVATPRGAEIKGIFNFKDACCISIDNQELNHDHLATTIKRNAQFIYHSYTVDQVTDVPEELFKNNIIK